MFNKKIISLSICIVLLSAIFSGCIGQQIIDDKLRIVDVSVGGGRVFAIAEDGTLWRWGVNLTNTFAIPTPHSTFPVQFGTDTNWEKVAATAAIKTDGTLWTWGDDNLHVRPLLGRETGAGVHIPIQVGIATNWKEVYDCGAFALRTDGTLWELQENWIVQFGTDTNWKQVVGGAFRYGGKKVAIKTNGTLWETYSRTVVVRETVWGWPLETRQERITTQVGTDTNWKRLSTWGNFAIKTDGSLWDLRADFPIQIGTDAWKYVDAGYYHTLAVRRDGTLWAWGRNHWGQLGLGHGDDRASPVQVGTDTNWKRVFAGHAFSLALKTDGTLWAWGHNNVGQLGLGDVTARLYPVQVRIKPQN